MRISDWSSDVCSSDLHTQVAGTAEFIAENDADSIRIAREIVKNLNWNAQKPRLELLPVRAPLHDVEELCGVVPTDYRKPFDCREVIARLVDRKSTRLKLQSLMRSSYAVFCSKKKNARSGTNELAHEPDFHQPAVEKAEE